MCERIYMHTAREVQCNFYLVDSHGHLWQFIDIFGSHEEKKDLAGDIGSGIHAQLATYCIVVINSAAHCRSVSTVAFHAVDGFNCGSEALPGGYGRMTVLHPKPHGCLEGNGGVLPHHVWVVQPVEAYVLPSWSVIVIPA